jgi:AraC-like DNA-binding protein
MNMLRDTDASVVSVAATLGYSSQTAFAAAFRKLTGSSPSDWRRRARLQQSRCNRVNRAGASAQSVH